MRLKDKVALITGANSGIGKGIAERFAAEGAHVAVNYLPGRGHDDETLKMSGAFPTEGMGAPGDVSKRADVEQLIAAVVKKFGRLDIAVNNAGIEFEKPFLDVSDDEWDKVLGADLYGSFVFSEVSA